MPGLVADDNNPYLGGQKLPVAAKKGNFQIKFGFEDKEEENIRTKLQYATKFFCQTKTGKGYSTPKKVAHHHNKPTE